MNSNPIRPRWLRKRIWLPLILLGSLTIASIVAFVNSDAAVIVIYNETGDSIGAIKVSACGQETILPAMAERESFCVKLKEAGTPGEIVLETATDPPWHWQGGYIEAQGGYRVTIRLWPNGEVEIHTQISVWQRVFLRAPNIHD